MQFKGVPVLVWTDVLKFLLIEESWLDVTSLNSLDNLFLLEFSPRYFMSLRKIAESPLLAFGSKKWHRRFLVY